MILNMVFFSLGPLNATEVEQETVKSSGYFTNETDSGLGSIWDDIYALLPPTDGGSEMDVILKQIEWKHNLVLWVLPWKLRAGLSPLLESWIANMLLGFTLYLGLGALWCLVIFRMAIDTRYGIQAENVPAAKDIWAQIKVSCSAIPLYTLLPPLSEWMIKQGWTLVYGRVASQGWGVYGVYFLLYMASVEFGVYWMHRKLHELKLGYKFLHATHHIYNKENTLSPMAGLAFNPVDGILQASPYVWTLFLVPMHFFTHEILLFATAVWTTNIHDCIYGGGEPIMGAAYHLIHHTHYKVNYGHYSIVCDWLFGTLKPPTNESDKKKD
eukprot:CAMPEP_0196586820 /NCGR_PEP_ID=MMETSP1081-20130531/55700_1 /TAXON_ID=36882 /ORGANISM="Pyramimonas amylifera, Strain CCMP720" /LENGTH=325 /DNA_ID=CAMNT_0041908825 /DNA_START=106 /DNA_END=1083 /DNA_ORIENTATION=+